MRIRARLLEFDKLYPNGEIFAQGCFDNLDNLAMSGEIIKSKIDTNKQYIAKTEMEMISRKIGLDIAKDNIALLEKQLQALLDGAENGI